MIGFSVMLDLETWGTAPGCAIASIGAVSFGGGKILGEFYERVELKSCLDYGLTVDADTVKWWLAQNKEAREEMRKPGLSLPEALGKFAGWIEPDAEVWGNGSDFDNPVLSAAYAAIRKPPPWKWRNNRCYRTARKLFPEIEMDFPGVKHNALDDARFQARYLMAILEKNDMNKSRIEQGLANYIAASVATANKSGEIQVLPGKTDVPVDPEKSRIFCIADNMNKIVGNVWTGVFRFQIQKPGKAEQIENYRAAIDILAGAFPDAQAKPASYATAYSALKAAVAAVAPGIELNGFVQQNQDDQEGETEWVDDIVIKAGVIEN